MADLTQLIRKRVKVYVGVAGADTSSAANFTEVGWCQGRETKVVEAGRNEIELDDDSNFKIGIDYEITFIGLETDTVKRQALEALEIQKIDILLVDRDDLATAEKFAGLTLSLSPNFVYSKKEVRKHNLKATVTAEKLSDIMTELTGLSGY